MTQLTYILEESEYEALQEYIKEEILKEASHIQGDSNAALFLL